jgi:CRISPR-associated protein Csb1
MPDLTQFDRYLNDDGPAALVIREYLMPVEGPDGVLFPATFAAGDGFPGGYNIDGDPNGTNVSLIDSVGSQANRIEPLFMQEKYRHLVPQIVIQAGDQEVNLLEAGHRAGDAIVRCTELQQTLQDAFTNLLKGDATLLARTSPTSLVFGVWDSRNTQAKAPRLVASTIRAFNVRPLRRGAVYVPPLDYAALDVFTEEEKQKAEGDTKNPLAKRGFVHVPASGTHGGVVATAGVRRDATLGLAALRLLTAGNDAEKTHVAQRYLLSLALVAFTAHTSNYLRQGCMLVRNPEKAKEGEFVEVYPNGDRKPATVTHDQALEFATSAAQLFGVGENRTVAFNKELASKDVKGEGDTKTKGKRGKKAQPAGGA